MNHALIQMIFPEVFTSTSGIFVSWTCLISAVVGGFDPQLRLRRLWLRRLTRLIWSEVRCAIYGFVAASLLRLDRESLPLELFTSLLARGLTARFVSLAVPQVCFLSRRVLFHLRIPVLCKGCGFSHTSHSPAHSAIHQFSALAVGFIV